LNDKVTNNEKQFDNLCFIVLVADNLV